MSFDIATYDVDKAARLATAFAQSGYFKDAKDVAQAMVKITAGAELGIGPMQAVNGIHVIQGKPALSANLLGALVKRHPRYDYRVKTLTDTECVLVFYQDGEASGESSFNMADAKAAGVLGNDTWKKYPRNMLLARALSNGVRWYCPDVTMSPVYVPEELGAAVDGDGDVIEVESHVVTVEPDVVVAAIVGAEPEPPKAKRKAPAAEDGASDPHWSERIEDCTDLDDCAALFAELEPWLAEPDNAFHARNTSAKFWARVNVLANDALEEARQAELSDLIVAVAEHDITKAMKVHSLPTFRQLVERANTINREIQQAVKAS